MKRVGMVKGNTIELDEPLEKSGFKPILRKKGREGLE